TLLGLRSELPVFFQPALVAVAVSFALLSIAAAIDIGNLLQGHPWKLEADAAVAVLAISISLLAAYSVSAGEHRLVSKLLFWPRLLVLGSAILSIFIAGAVVIDADSRWLFFLIGALFNLPVLIVLIVGLARTSLDDWRTTRTMEANLPIEEIAGRP
ncbi:hypothetical protein, partial [Mesorhizobium japonicum]|uniref:hypothetical protein n=1 Tax=Mesorhizobium japonicum TaxID=2066070 RepID=UPI003B599010